MTLLSGHIGKVDKNTPVKFGIQKSNCEIRDDEEQTVQTTINLLINLISCNSPTILFFMWVKDLKRRSSGWSCVIVYSVVDHVTCQQDTLNKLESVIIA